MAEVYFAGDGHFGHANILKFRPEFKSIEEHDSIIIKNINEVVTKRDKLFLTGDWVFNEGAMDLISEIQCPHVHLLLGNHDDLNLDYKRIVKWVSGDIKYKEFWLSHIPIHPMEMRGKLNIHAHLHKSIIRDRRYLSTSLEVINYTPISLQQIRSIFKERGCL